MASISDDEHLQLASLDKKPSPRRNTSLAFIQSKLRRLNGNSPGDRILSTVDAKGPLGLNLLHEPSEPRIDFIFVHGLFGGSRKTWSYSQDPAMFWPKEWLPNEVGFRHVRLHSYGYNSDGSRRKSFLTVHDFAQALLADIYNSPELRKHGDTPIVFVAHSMGGLVVKKAYLLAVNDPTYKSISHRIHTMYFLGTPHRGADSAQITRTIRYAAGHGSKAYIDDLVPGSGALNVGLDTLDTSRLRCKRSHHCQNTTANICQQINDEFRHVCSSVRLWSFFEGVPTAFGLLSSLVVEKESAILGLPGEHIQYVDADHRHLCKFDSPNSPNYILLQRAFLTTIEELEADSLCQRRDEYSDQMKQVSSFLQVEQRPDAFLLAINEKQHQGSCQWLTADDTFQHWVNGPDPRGDDDVSQQTSYELEEDARILWLTGRPGTGKSVASSHVVRYLEACNLDCSFYFFRHSDEAGSTIAALLQSLAFQMAKSSYEVRRAIVSIAEDGVRLSHCDHHMLWNKIFVQRIFRLDSLKPQFWVIDAVDECSSNGTSALVAMLSKLDHTTPIRVFMTSRPGGQLERSLTQQNVLFKQLSTGQSGSLRDIQAFLQARCPQLQDTESHEMFLSNVLSKSNGIFLWASLVAARLENIFTVEDMQETLQTIPSEMDGFYSRIADSIVASPSCALVTCILKWVICSPRALTTGELAEAVKLDIDRTLAASSAQLEAITGHLILVDSQSRVHVTHATTSSFLTRRREGLWIDQPMAHSKIAEVCLTTLCGADFAPPKTRRAAGSASKKAASPLNSYAAANFGYHLMHSSPAGDALLIQLNAFLRSNVLTWIERIAESGSLSTLQQTSQRLNAYLTRRAKYHPPVSLEVQTVSGWVNDIHHLVAAFHSALLASPSSIHIIIPYLCPPASIIRQLFAKPNKRLKITGPLDEDWSDRLTSYLFSAETKSIACCERLLAVGLKNGDIRIYDTAGVGTFEAVGTLIHGKKVRQLAFDPSSSFLASCSVRKLMLWDIRRSSGPSFPCLWAQDLDFTPNQVIFDREGTRILLSDPIRCAINSFEAVSGSSGGGAILLHSSQDSDSSDSEEQMGSWAAAEHVYIDNDQKLAALTYRNSTVSIWDLDAMENVGNFERDGYEGVYSSPPALDLAFNPISELDLLAISYSDGDVVLCNPWTLEQTEKCNLPHSLVILTSTSDGRVLAGGAEDGVIHLLLFKTLRPLYRVQPPDARSQLCGLTFSANNLQFFEIRAQSCNVWEPLVLVTGDTSDEGSSEPQSEEVPPQEPSSSSAHAFQWRQRITAIQTTERGLFFVGRQDGTVDICDGSSGEVVKRLRLHGGFARIKQLGWNEANNILLSLDAHSRCIVSRLSFDTEPQPTVILNHRERDIVRQALLSPDATSILVRTDAGLKLIAVARASVSAELDFAASFCSSHPSSLSQLIAFQPGRIHLFDWASLARLSPAKGIVVASFPPPSKPSDIMNGVWFGRPGSAYLALCANSSNRHRPTCFAALDASKLAPENGEATEIQVLTSHKIQVRIVVGVVKNTLYFIDTAGWISSVGLKRLRQAAHYTRHFFIPPTWYMGGDVVIAVVTKTAVAFARGEQLMVFHGFLEFEERVPLGEEMPLVSRPSKGGTSKE
ncbi:uncharacterized protein B0H64DRAFT_106611 [Chaetomium fimeti]|uniref:GPI inositol-deacylase n=1 Tax=Chaetomium fimeti TaxID=1854472 RepID=A0AAE0HI15_9PEZI|nr:hypothetical protein B0H64DRAFT_106611 [Chaetomium fimeti]